MIQVLKFGGSSVADATCVSRVLDIVSAAVPRGRVVLVSSAVSGCTDTLVEIGRTRDEAVRDTLIRALRSRHEAMVTRLFTGSERRSCLTESGELFEQLSAAAPDYPVEIFGELLSTTIIARKLACDGIQTLWIDSRALITTRDARVDRQETYRRIRRVVGNHPQVQVFVAPGFIASDESGRAVTLGRGGSDYSAALYAAALEADVFEIWTDVPGIMTTNPKDVPSARTITDISYGSALEMAVHGAKVLYAPTVEPVMERGIPFRIRNTFDPACPGTLVSSRTEQDVEDWKGIACSAAPDSSDRLLCLVGEGVRSPEAVCSRITSALKGAGISSCAPVGRTELGSFIIPVRGLVYKEALAALHREFFEAAGTGVTDVFIAGHGAVGKALMELAERSSERIARRVGRRIRIVGLSDSRHYVIDLEGLTSAGSAARLEEGDGASTYVDAVTGSERRDAVFVDCTDSHDLHLRYPDLLRAGISIVTSNRRSVAVPYPQYASYKALARENGVFFRYDTSVGAALPILESIAGEANCSDRITSIEAVVSCTLNYIITSYDGANTEPMAALLRRAQDSGLTEKDPRADIGGRDALRKLLILGREAGIPLEEEDVQITPMLGPEFFDCTLEEFYSRLAAYEQTFIEREAELDRMDMRQRFVASLHRDKAHPLGWRAEIKMRLVDRESPFWSITGAENVTVIRSEYSAPLVIKGAGEGASLAASGIIKDILM